MPAGTLKNYQEMVKSLSSLSISFPEKAKICSSLLVFNKEIVVDFVLKNYKKFPDFNEFKDLIFKLSLGDKKLIEILIFFKQFEILATLNLEIQQIQEFLNCEVMVKLFIANHKKEKNKKKMFKNIVKILSETQAENIDQNRELLEIMFTTKELLQELEFFLANNQITFVSEFFTLLKTKASSDSKFLPLVMDEFVKAKSKLSFKMFQYLATLNYSTILPLMEIIQLHKVYDKQDESQKIFLKNLFDQNYQSNDFLKVFIKLDFEIVDDNLGKITPDLEFSIQLLDFYAKSRQTLKLLEKLDDSVLSSHLFLVQFQSQIMKMLPSQSFQILEYLKLQILGQLQAALPPNKKQKSGSRPISVTTRLKSLCGLFVYAITRAQVNISQKPVFENFLKSFYVEIIEPTISIKNSQHVSPLLQIHIVLMQLSNQYWVDFFTTEKVLGLFDNCGATQDIQTVVELACHHIHLLLFANTFIDNAVGECISNDEGLKKLVMKIWDNYKDCKIIIQEHICTLSSVSEKDQIRAFVKKFIKQLNGDPHSNLLTYAPFYEIKEVKTWFLPEFFRKVSKSCQGEISNYFSVISKKLPTNDHIDTFAGCSMVPISPPSSLSNLISVLDLIPNCYFTNRDRELLQTFSYLLSLPCLLDRFVSCRRDVVLTLGNIHVLERCSKSSTVLEATFKKCCLDKRYHSFLETVCVSDWISQTLPIKSLFKTVNTIKFLNPVVEELAEKVLDNHELMKDLTVVDVILEYFERIKKPKNVADFVDTESKLTAKLMLKWGDNCKRFLPHIPTEELVGIMGDWLHRSTSRDYEDLVAYALEFVEENKSLRLLLFLCQNAHAQLGRSLIYSNWSKIVLQICDIVKRCNEEVAKASFEVLTYVAKDKSFSLSCAEVSLMMGSISSLELSLEIPTPISFDLIYSLLYSIIKHRPKELMNLVPQFNQAISSLLDCFVIDTKNKRGVDKLYKSHALGLLPEGKIAFFKKIVRILGLMNGKPFAKYAPFMLARLLSLNLCNEVREEWRYACFACLESCDDYGKMYLMKALSTGLIAVYKGILSDYEGWKYKGKA